MIRALMLGLTVLAMPIVSSPSLGQAANRDEARGEPPATQEPTWPRFKVAYWFDGKAVRHRVYDLRKGRFPQEEMKVWLRTMRVDYPGFAACVVDLDLELEWGATDEEKLTAAIKRHQPKARHSISELYQPLKHRSLGLSELLHPNLGDYPATSTSARPREVPNVSGPRASRVFLAPTPASFPTPYPYPRPHP